MDLSYLDWMLMAALTVGLPFLGLAMHRRTAARVEAGVRGARIEHYRRIIILEWSILIVTLIVWAVSERSRQQLGLGLSLGVGWWLGVALALAASVLLVLQWLGLRSKEEKLRQMSVQFESLKAMLPHNNREQRWFGAVSISAGICEEIVYRGFLLGVLTALAGGWLAVPVSSLIFGLAHLYQGPRGIAKTAVVGMVMAGLTVLTGSLWAAILVHIVVDITSGLIAQRVAAVSWGRGEEIGAPA